LLVPGRRFLSHFEEATLTEGERDVVLINTEMGRGPMLDALREAGVTTNCGLSVEHLDEDHGVPEAFDLTNPYIFDMWAERLVWCESCEGSDEGAPTGVIVDNLTAVLQAVGKPLEAYGELHGAFVRLLATIGCPNGLTVVHNTLEGGHAMGGVTGQNRQAGRWSYWTSNGDDPYAARWFKVVPRYPGKAVPATKVTKKDGRLLMAEPAAMRKAPEPPSPQEPNTWARDDVLARLTGAGAAGLLRREVTDTGRVGMERRAALDALIEAGDVIERDEPTSGRGGPRRCWLSASAPD
jgi:hypothetical protein